MKSIYALLTFIFLQVSFAQSWNIQADFPAAERDDAVAFTLLGKGYCVTGKTPGFVESNFMFAYNPNNNTWERKADFPGIKRQYASVFKLYNKAYLIGGYDENGNALKEVWEYEPLEDKWSQKNDFPDSARWSAIAFSINNKGYFGLGTTHNSLLKDIWEYTPKTDTWQPKKDFPGIGRRDAIGVAIYNRALVGLGHTDFSSSGQLKDLYEYSAENDSWKSLADYPGEGRSYTHAESINNKIFIGGGMKEDLSYANDTWSFDFLSKEWKNQPNFPGNVRGCSQFVIGQSLYICTGLIDNIGRAKFLYSLTIDKEELKIFPNPTSDFLFLNLNNTEFPAQLKIYSLQGNLVQENTLESNNINISNLPQGNYILIIENAQTQKLIYSIIKK